MIRPRARPVSRASVGAVVLALVLLASGCGGSGGDAGRDATTGGSTIATTGAAASSGPTEVPTSTTGPVESTGGRVEVARASWRLPSPVAREVLAVDGTDLVVAGGLDASKVSTGAVVRVDTRRGVASSVATLDPAVHDAAGVLEADRLVVVAGGLPPAIATVQSVGLGDGAVRRVGSLPAPRADHVAARVGKSLYVLGGGDEGGALLGSVVASDDDGATWRSAGSLAVPVRYPAIAVVDGAVYLFGGVASTAGADTPAVQRFDPATGTTTVVAQLPAPLSHAVAVVLGGAVYLLGGFVENAVSAQILRFDPRRESATGAGTMPEPVTDGAGAVVGDTAYYAGGQGTDRAPVATVVTLRVAAP